MHYMELIPSSMTDSTLESYLGKISSRSKIIYWIIIGFVTCGLAILPFIHVDISVQARGFFQSEIEKQVIYSPFQGKVIFTSVKNGREVNKDDTLFIIDAETVKAQKEAIMYKMIDNNAAIYDLEKLVQIESFNPRFAPTDFYTKRYYTEFSNMKRSLAVQFQKYQKSKTAHERNIVLHDQEIIPDIEFENSLFAYKTDKEGLSQILISYKSSWQADLMQRGNDASSLQADQKRCTEELNNRVVLAPVNGEIIQSVDIQTGTFVTTNQKIAEISPKGRLVATCYVKPDDIGLIHTGQKVRLQVDAFNYNEWGFLNAEIIDISDDLIVEDGSTAYFRIRCMPEQTSLSLRNGAEAEIKKGMSFSSRIFVTRRSLFNLIFDRADKWLNPYLTKQS
jgi:membrane fusion protein, peptide pheromone/bacteriocin exporter